MESSLSTLFPEIGEREPGVGLWLCFLLGVATDLLVTESIQAVGCDRIPPPCCGEESVFEPSALYQPGREVDMKEKHCSLLASSLLFE